MQRDRERRYKIAYFDENLLLKMLNGFRQCEYMSLPVCEEIPEDAVVDAVQFDFSRKAFAIRIYHKSYPAVPDGQLIPVLDSPVILETFRRVKVQPAQPPAPGVKFREFL